MYVTEEILCKGARLVSVVREVSGLEIKKEKEGVLIIAVQAQTPSFPKNTWSRLKSLHAITVLDPDFVLLKPLATVFDPHPTL